MRFPINNQKDERVPRGKHACLQSLTAFLLFVHAAERTFYNEPVSSVEARQAMCTASSAPALSRRPLLAAVWLCVALAGRSDQLALSIHLQSRTRSQRLKKRDANVGLHDRAVC
ncbi:hypothetical protein SRHO_G00265020 [Serrasalmus rhombeus]